MGLVNNAGISESLPAELMDIDIAKRVYEVNVFGVFRASKAFLPMLKQNPGSRVVNVGSVAGVVATFGSSIYSGTKFAVEAMSDSTRLEWKVGAKTRYWPTLTRHEYE